MDLPQRGRECEAKVLGSEVDLPPERSAQVEEATEASPS